MSSWFRNIEPAPKDPILGVAEAFLADQSPYKVNVGVVSSSSTFCYICFGYFFSAYFEFYYVLFAKYRSVRITMIKESQWFWNVLEKLRGELQETNSCESNVCF